MKLRNGTYISPRGDFQHGIVSYNPQTEAVSEWEIGFDSDNVSSDKSRHVSMRAVSYGNNLIGEIYGGLPKIVLHQEDGTIHKVYSFRGLNSDKNPDADCFKDIYLAESYIAILYGDPDMETHSYVFVIDYDGRPIGNLQIEPAQSILVDEQRHRLIAINANSDDSNVIVYNLE